MGRFLAFVAIFLLPMAGAKAGLAGGKVGWRLSLVDFIIPKDSQHVTIPFEERNVRINECTLVIPNVLHTDDGEN